MSLIGRRRLIRYSRFPGEGHDLLQISALVRSAEARCRHLGNDSGCRNKKSQVLNYCALGLHDSQTTPRLATTRLRTAVNFMSASSSVNIAELIDGRPLGRMQITIIVLCGLVALLDGFDLLAIGVAAPAMAGPLHIAPNQLGAVFSAALFGLMFGAFGLGPIADRYGRRCVLISATAMFGVFALGSVFGTPLAGFLVSRFAVRSVLPAALVGSALTLGGVGYASQSIILVIMLMGSVLTCQAISTQ